MCSIQLSSVYHVHVQGTRVSSDTQVMMWGEPDLADTAVDLGGALS